MEFVLSDRQTIPLNLLYFINKTNCLPTLAVQETYRGHEAKSK